MITFILHLYLLLFPRCEMMVSFLNDFDHCNDSSAWSDYCRAMSDQGYGAVRPSMPLARWYEPEMIVVKLPFVQIVSCWR